MPYLYATIAILILSRLLSGSWKKTFLLPWVIVLTPMLVGAWLSNLRILPQLVSPWSPEMHMLVASGSIAMGLGSFTMKHIRGPLDVRTKDLAWDETSVIRIMLFLVIITAVANATEFFIAGKIPLFSEDPSRARGEVARYGWIHVVSSIPGHLIPLSGFVFLTGGRLSSRARRVMILTLVVSLFITSLWFSRGRLFFPIVTVVAMNYILDQKTFGFKKIISVALIMFFIIGGIKYLRGYVKYGESYGTKQQKMLGSDISEVILVPAVSLYLTVAMNYEILNRYVQTVPILSNHTHGKIIAGHITSFLPGKQFTELEYQNALLKKNDYDASLTSTAFGLPYLEFGFAGVIGAGFLVGLLYKMVWKRLVMTGSPLSIFIYAYLISMAAFIPYTFMYIKVGFLWFILSASILVLLFLSRIKGVSLFYRNKSRVVFAPNGENA